MFRQARTLLLLLSLIFFTGAGSAWCRAAMLADAAAALTPKETSRYVVLWQNARVGTMVMKTYDVTHAGKGATRADSETQLKITAMGQVIEQQVDSSRITDAEGRPVSMELVTKSAGRTTTIRASFKPDRVVCEVDAGGQKSTKTVPIPKGVSLITDPQNAGGTLKESLKVGRKDRYHFFEPITLTIQAMESEVVKAESREAGGKKIPAYLVRITTQLSGATDDWMDAQGNLLESNSPLGIRFVREDLAGSSTAYEPPKDLIIATSVKTAVKLPDPRNTRLLRVKIGGIGDEKLILSDPRQQVAARQRMGDDHSVTYLVQARDLPAASLTLVKPGEMAPGLGDAPYLGVDDPTMRKQAQALAAEGGDRVAVARRIRAWIYGHMKPSNIGTFRGAPEIMRSRDGVCRDYAILAAALGRAAGIPARVCSGIIYFQDGFYYHAWAEYRLTEGEDGWYPVDPTLDTDFVDATHIKFAQGDPAEMFAAIRLIGQLKAEILEHR